MGRHLWSAVESQRRPLEGSGERGWHKRGNMNGFQKSIGVQGKRRVFQARRQVSSHNPPSVLYEADSCQKQPETIEMKK